MKHRLLLVLISIAALCIIFFPLQSGDDLLEEDPAACGRIWHFERTTVDNNPPAKYRINDTAIADINSDGLPDIWVSGRAQDTSGENLEQMVWYENPSWTRHTIAKGNYKYGILADVNKDKAVDIIVGRQWFENLGPDAANRIKWSKHSLGYDFEPDLLRTGDIDGDQLLDLVVFTKHELYWLPLAREIERKADLQQTSLQRIFSEKTLRAGGTLADINHDGHLDVIWGNSWFKNPEPKPSLPWAKIPIDEDWPTQARAETGDLNGDGRIDIILSGEESTHGIVWYQAPPDPASGRWKQYDISSSKYQGVHSLAAADFDLDGDLDVFAAEMHHGEDPDKLSIFENVDISENIWREHVFSDIGSHNAKVGDLNGDGYPDIVGKNYQAGDLPLSIELWINQLPQSPLALNHWQKIIIDNDRPWKALFVDSGDINGDGLVDIISGAWWYENPGSSEKSWSRHTIGGKLYNMSLVYDLDNDGDLDVLGTTGKVESNEFIWAENNGSGAFSLHTNIPSAKGDFLQGARAAHLDNTKTLNILLSWHNYTSTQAFTVPAPAANPWHWKELSPHTNGEQIAVGDIDLDGDTDIHLGDAWLENQQESWPRRPGTALGGEKTKPDRVELADINQDGRLDVVIGAEHECRLVWGEAPEDLSKPWKEHVISLDLLAMSLDVGDLDDDGDIDVVAGEHNKDPGTKQGRLVIYRNRGRGNLWDACTIDRGMDHHCGTRLVDIDKDDDLDIISIGWLHNQVVLYENKAR